MSLFFCLCECVSLSLCACVLVSMRLCLWLCVCVPFCESVCLCVECMVVHCRAWVRGLLSSGSPSHPLTLLPATLVGRCIWVPRATLTWTPGQVMARWGALSWVAQSSLSEGGHCQVQVWSSGMWGSWPRTQLTLGTPGLSHLVPWLLCFMTVGALPGALLCCGWLPVFWLSFQALSFALSSLPLCL